MVVAPIATVHPEIHCVARFRERIAEGAVGEIGNFFSLSSAYQYWRDVTTSTGAACPEEALFRQMVMEHFRSAEVRTEAASYRPVQFRSKLIGCVGSVVFRRGGADGCEAVATVVLERDVWRVRTYPGVFPGTLLDRAKRPAAFRAGKSEVEDEG